MNAEYLLNAIGLLDDDLILEAETYKKPRPAYGHWMALAACFAVVLVLGYGLTHLGMGGNASMNNSGGAAPAASNGTAGGGNELPSMNAPEEIEPSLPASSTDSSLGGNAPSSSVGSSPQEQDYCAAIMVDGILYWSTETPIPIEVDESAIQIVTSYINTVPQMDGQTNFSQDLSAQYAMTDRGLVVLMDHEWVLFDPVPPWER